MKKFTKKTTEMKRTRFPETRPMRRTRFAKPKKEEQGGVKPSCETSTHYQRNVSGIR